MGKDGAMLWLGGGGGNGPLKFEKKNSIYIDTNLAFLFNKITLRLPSK